MNVHGDWTTGAFALPAVAPHTGPFPRAPFLATWWNTRSGDEDEIHLVEGAEALLPLVTRGERLEFAGEENLVDYHCPLGSGVPELLAEFMTSRAPASTYRFDSLPAEAVEPMLKGLALAGIPAEAEQHEVAAILDLPDGFDAWLASIGKKERHEVRRKRRRFVAELAEPRLERQTDPAAVELFADMHRRAGGDKGEFMTEDMQRFFAALHGSAGAVIDVLTADGTPIAAGFGFETPDTYFLYNSAYEPDHSHASPGIVLLAALVEQAIDAGLKRFDFLKGDETYKFRHGAHERPLYVIEGRL